MNEQCRYIIMKGENACEVNKTNSLNEAKKIVKDLDSMLTADEFDDCKNHWIYDTYTDSSIDV